MKQLRKLSISQSFWAFLIGINIGIIIKMLIDTILK